MARPLRWAAIVLASLLGLSLLAAGGIYVASEIRLRRTYSAPRERVVIRSDSTAQARGRHLVEAVTTCGLCHGEDGGGAVYADMGPIGRVVGASLTRAKADGSPALSDDDWVRAVRYGVRHDGTSLIVMPSEVFTHLSDSDLGAIIAHYRRLPPVDHRLPDTRFGPLGRALLATGKLNILVAPKTPRNVVRASVTPGPTVEYGRYLADISGCHGCHGYGLSGGKVAGPPGLPPASNLTPAGLGTWTEADFTRAMREGKRPAGSTLNEFMPWKVFGKMTDEEIRALWLYLKSVPPREFGNK